MMKDSLYNACKASIRQKVDRVKMSIQEAQESANEETKSSAGDKYETGRAMAQLEIEKLGAQLTELYKQEEELGRVDHGLQESIISLGSVVYTNHGIFYIAVNVGEIIFEGRKVFAISSRAPIAQKMIGLSVGDAFTLNGRSFTIEAVQ